MNPWFAFWGLVAGASIFTIGFMFGSMWANRESEECFVCWPDEELVTIAPQKTPYDRVAEAQSRRRTFRVVE